MGWKAAIDAGDSLDRDRNAFRCIQDSRRAFASERDSDIAAEQDKLRWADALILRFPLWWFRCRRSSRWVDRVSAYGFAMASVSIRTRAGAIATARVRWRQTGDADRDYRWLEAHYSRGDQRAHRRPTVPHSSRHPALRACCHRSCAPTSRIDRPDSRPPRRAGQAPGPSGALSHRLSQTERRRLRHSGADARADVAPGQVGFARMSNRNSSRGRGMFCRYVVRVRRPFDRTDHLLGGVLNLDVTTPAWLWPARSPPVRGWRTCCARLRQPAPGSVAPIDDLVGSGARARGQLPDLVGHRETATLHASPGSLDGAFNASGWSARRACGLDDGLISSDRRAPRCHRWRTAPGR